MAEHHGNNGQVSERSRTDQRPLHPEGAGRIITSAGPFSALTPNLITNGIILDVLNVVQIKKQKWQDVAATVSKIYGTYLHSSTVHSSFIIVKSKKQKLSKRKEDTEALAAFKEEVYTPPKPRGKRPNDNNDQELPVPAPKRFQPFEKAALDLGTENAMLHKQVDELKAENITLNCQCDNLKQTLSFTNAKLSNLYKTLGNRPAKPKYVIQTLKRRNAQAEHWRNQARKLHNQVLSLTHVVQKFKAKDKSLKKLQKLNVNRKIRANQKKVTPRLNTMVLTESLATALNTVSAHKNNLAVVENELCQSEETLQELKSQNIAMRDSKNTRKIHPAVKETSMYLQAIGVAEHNVGQAMESVISTLTDCELQGNLPSKSSQQRIASEMKAVAKQHLRHELKDQRNLTLKYDGTTKDGKHLVEVQIERCEGTLTLGVQETVGGTASDYVDCIEELVNDVDPNIMGKITNTMTDRCITNCVVDKELEKKVGHEIHSFRCAVHPLDTIHRQVENAVKQIEKEQGMDVVQENNKFPFQNRGESKTQSLLRAVDKLFHCSASGLPRDLPHFLKDRGLATGGNLYPRWVGNRFNIFFVNAGLLYYYADHIQEFFQKVVAPRNNLHHAVINALRQEPSLMPILRALGLVDKYITGPWMAWQGENPNILEASPIFTNVIQQLDEFDATAAVSGKRTTVFNTPVKEDAKFDQLIKPSHSNKETANTLHQLVSEIKAVMQRQLVDHLPGGKYSNPSPQLVDEAASCSSHNISGERVFAVWDAKHVQAKSACATKVSSKTMFSMNKVREQFLAGKTREEKENIIHTATTQAGMDRLMDLRKKHTLVNAINEKLEKSRQLIEKRENNRRAEKEKILESVIAHGIWKDEQDITNGLKPLSKSKSTDAIKAQIRFWTLILDVKPHKRIIFNKSSLQDLQTYLCKLTTLEVPQEREMILNIIENPNDIVGLNFNQKWTTENGDSMCRGVIADLIENPNKENEYACQFENEVCYQTVSEVLADLAVGDISLYA